MKVTSTKNTRKFKAFRKEKGQCIDCGLPHQTGHLRCQACLDLQAAYARQKRQSKS
ncbi:MAG: hypothetical protein H7X94_12710 [Vallitaleaceae bacterium]|nr:hypothetical protein [Vallitaleaceae bacterium]